MPTSNPKPDEVSLHGVRAEIRQLNVRMGGVEDRMTRVEDRCTVIGDSVGKVSLTMAVVDTKLDSVLANQERDSDLHAHEKKVEIESKAEQETALIKLEDTKVTHRSKILAGILGLFSMIAGAIIHSVM